MFSRSRLFSLGLLALTFVFVEPLLAHDKAEGTVVSSEQLKLTFSVKEKKHTYDVAKDAKITLDGKAAKLADLKAGVHVKLTLGEKHVITSIIAESKQK